MKMLDVYVKNSSYDKSLYVIIPESFTIDGKACIKSASMRFSSIKAQQWSKDDLIKQDQQIPISKLTFFKPSDIVVFQKKWLKGDKYEVNDLIKIDSDGIVVRLINTNTDNVKMCYDYELSLVRRMSNDNYEIY